MTRRLLALFLLTAACGGSGDDPGIPAELDDGKMDDPDYVANGPLVFDEEQPVEVLLGGAHFHSWTFQLDGEATLSASTGLLDESAYPFALRVICNGEGCGDTLAE